MQLRPLQRRTVMARKSIRLTYDLFSRVFASLSRVRRVKSEALLILGHAILCRRYLYPGLHDSNRLFSILVSPKSLRQCGPYHSELLRSEITFFILTKVLHLYENTTTVPHQYHISPYPGTLTRRRS
jgi:hypothetical protein